jgi:hypothetical protein
MSGPEIEGSLRRSSFIRAAASFRQSCGDEGFEWHEWSSVYASSNEAYKKLQTLRCPPSHGRLMLTVLGGLAEFERELIRSRTTEGRDRAKARGVKMGRPSKLTPHQKKEAIKRRDHGEETLAEIGRSYNVSGWTIARLHP